MSPDRALGPLVGRFSEVRILVRSGAYSRPRRRQSLIHRSSQRDCMKSSWSGAPRVLFVDAWPQKWVCSPIRSFRESSVRDLQRLSYSPWKIKSQKFGRKVFLEAAAVFSHSPCGERDIADTKRRTIPPP